ncbi:MAG: sugar phosphate isomerase/epimerase family protein [Dehalococcoidia bacterium]
MKLGCSSWSYQAAFRDGRIDLREWVRICAEELELDGVELVDVHFPTTDAVYLRDLKKLCTDLQLTIAGVAVTNDFGPSEKRALETQHVKQWCDVAAYLGAPVVRVFAGWVPPQRLEQDPGRIVGFVRKVLGTKAPNTRRLWSDITWALRQCADYAGERGVVLAIQNNRADGVVGSAQQLEQCVHDVGSPWLRICLDPADLADRAGVEAAMGRVVQTHAKLRDVRDDGSDASIHWPELLRMLRLGRYRGFVLLDYEGGEDPETAVPRASRYIRGILHLLQRQQLLAAGGADGASRDNGAVLVETELVAPVEIRAAR